ILEILLLAEILGLIFLCPYTKVEESFNMQAMHDLLFLGPGNLRSFDHFSFPGVVPRTFLGALAVAFLSSPVHLILHHMSNQRPATISTPQAATKVPSVMDRLYFTQKIKVVSLLFNESLVLNVTKSFPICPCQFHLPFYLSRPLPNTFALILLLFAYTAWLDGNAFVSWMLKCSARLCTILRLITHQTHVPPQVTLGNAIIMGVASTAMSIFTTVAYDSIMWQKLVWPEGAVLFFNTVENKSSEWGTSPPLWYLYSALPRALLATALFIPVSRCLRSYLSPPFLYYTLNNGSSLSVLPYFCVPVVFIGLYSVLPHKELRFIFPALPLFNIVAGVGLSKLISIR
ncbi:unnamed protein product, partial [Heterosigma akashiwo]